MFVRVKHAADDPLRQVLKLHPDNPVILSNSRLKNAAAISSFLTEYRD
jgi:hypothetical protein